MVDSFLLIGALAAGGAPASRDYPIQPIPFTQVHLTDEFWSPRIETNRTVTIPLAFEQCEKNGRMYNFERAAAVLRGERVDDLKPPGFPFDDTDVYKVIEGASYAMAVRPDPKLDAYIDGLIAKIAAAQEPDGYLYTTRTISPEHPHPWAGTERWLNTRELSHELYNLGHLYEAATAHYAATGKRSLLDVALRTADLLDRTFGVGKQSIWPGHQIVEMGLVKLYRVTGERRYLDLAKFMLDARGPDGHRGSGRTYNQSHEPVVEQREAVGHAVRATYMYAGMADVAAITGDEAYTRAIDAIWENVAGRKLYITGGIGAKHDGEAFGSDHELPNLSAYCETCAAIGNVYWNQRLFLLHGDAKYIDVLERSLYNGVLSGISLDGTKFFYPNPLESDGSHARQPWFGCACCPSNLCRFMASIPGYFYAHRDGELFVNLFASGEASVALDETTSVRIAQQTNYPWTGDVTLTLGLEAPKRFALNVRIPGWARGEVVASDLYRFVGEADATPTLTVNGEPVAIDLKLGYARLERAWKDGDVVALTLPMTARRVIANDAVEADRGRVAIERGPIVYCVEWPDVRDGRPREVTLDDDTPLATDQQTGPLGRIVTIAPRADDQPAWTAIPYYAWANRGKGEMAVWLCRTESAAGR